MITIIDCICTTDSRQHKHHQQHPAAKENDCDGGSQPHRVVIERKLIYKGDRAIERQVFLSCTARLIWVQLIYVHSWMSSLQRRWGLPLDLVPFTSPSKTCLTGESDLLKCPNQLIFCFLMLWMRGPRPVVSCKVAIGILSFCRFPVIHLIIWFWKVFIFVTSVGFQTIVSIAYNTTGWT